MEKATRNEPHEEGNEQADDLTEVDADFDKGNTGGREAREIRDEHENNSDSIQCAAHFDA